MTFNLSAIYHGKNQVFKIAPEVDFAKNNQYELEVRQAMFGRIEINVVRGFHNKHVAGTRTLYPSMFHFFLDWEPKQLGRIQ